MTESPELPEGLDPKFIKPTENMLQVERDLGAAKANLRESEEALPQRIERIMAKARVAMAKADGCQRDGDSEAAAAYLAVAESFLRSAVDLRLAHEKRKRLVRIATEKLESARATHAPKQEAKPSRADTPRDDTAVNSVEDDG